MSGPVVASFDAVRMSYPLWSYTGADMKGFFASPSRLAHLWTDGPPALDGVSFEVRAGRTLGLVGPNGAGKSTALALLAGVLRPRAGRVDTRGLVCAALHQESGFHRDLTGRENALLLGVLFGQTRASMRARLDAVARGAGLGGAFDEPLRTYSMGMIVRLGLSVAESLEPGILLIDDHLSFGDARFQVEFHERLSALKKRGAAVVLATHSIELVARLCDEAVWLAKGRVEASGPAAEVAARYASGR